MDANGDDDVIEIKKDTTTSTSSQRSRSRDRDRSRSDRDKDRSSRRSTRRSRSRSIHKSRSSSRQGGSGSTKRVYVANIPFDCKWNELKDLFREKIGDVAYVELFSDENGKFRGCGIVEMKDSSSVDKAVDILHRYEYKGRQLVIKEDFNVERDKYGFLKKPSRDDYDRGRDRPDGYRDGYRPNDGYRSGRGTDGGSNNDGGGQNDMQFNNYGLNPDFLASLGIRGPLTCRVFVSNLEYKVDAKKLEDIFACAGTVVNVDLKTDHDGVSKGMAVVEFAHPIEAVQAISMLNGQKLYTRTMNMRMDRYGEDSDRSSKKLPTGLSGIGKGLGLDGQPLHLSRMNMNNILPGGATANQIPGMGIPNVNPVAATAATGLGLMGNPGMGNLAALSNLGANSMNSMNSMTAANMGLGALGLGMSGLSNNSLSGGGDRSMMGNAMGNVPGLNSNANLAGLSSSINASLASLGMSGQQASNLVMGNSNPNSASNPMAGLGMNLSSGVGLMSSAGLGGASSMSALGLGQSGNNMMGAGAIQNSPSTPSNNANQGFNNNGSNFDRGFDNRNNSGEDYRRPRSSDTVEIRNLPNTQGWETVRERFKEIGQIRFSEIKGRGTAVIRFSMEREAQRAVDLMNGLRVDGRPIEVRLY